jgi:hypothetical protein
MNKVVKKMDKKIIALHLLNNTVVLAEIVGLNEHYDLIVKTDFQAVSEFWANLLNEYYVEKSINPTDEKDIYIVE